MEKNVTTLRILEAADGSTLSKNGLRPDDDSHQTTIVVFANKVRFSMVRKIAEYKIAIQSANQI